MSMDVMKDSRETIILKEECKNLNPKNHKEDKTKTFLMHNLKRFTDELRRAFRIQRNNHLFLQSQLEYLKNENLETANKVLCTLQVK
jgi:hypothetical protein